MNESHITKTIVELKNKRAVAAAFVQAVDEAIEKLEKLCEGGKFMAGYWQDGKVNGLGTYMTVELAAAAVADHEGRTEDARRLRAKASGRDLSVPTPVEMAHAAGKVEGSNARTIV